MPSVNLGRVKGDKGVSMRNRGDWNSEAKYLNDEHYIDFVSHRGCLWTCLETNTNVEPSDTAAEWNLTAKSIDTIYFEQALNRENIVSGEPVSTAFGKIAKWFTDISNGGASTLMENNLTEGRVLVSNTSGKVSVSSVTSALLGYLSGITSNVQAQLNAKVNSSNILKSLNITSEGFIMDGKTASEAFAELNSKLIFNTAETAIGTWTDGRTIYRKCFIIGQLANATSTTRAHGISNLDRPVHLYGSAKDTTLSSNFTVSLPYVSSTDVTKQINIGANNTNIVLYHAAGNNKYSAVVIMEYIKTA